jgi:hypothetical protein
MPHVDGSLKRVFFFKIDGLTDNQDHLLACISRMYAVRIWTVEYPLLKKKQLYPIWISKQCMHVVRA